MTQDMALFISHYTAWFRSELRGLRPRYAELTAREAPELLHVGIIAQFHHSMYARQLNERANLPDRTEM